MTWQDKGISSILVVFNIASPKYCTFWTP